MYNEGGSSFAEGYAIGRDTTSGGYGNGMWGGDWAWWIVILLIFGWGNNGFGGGFGNNGGGLMTGLATQNDIQRGFDNQSVINKLNGIENGLCDGFYAMNTSLLTGFNGTERAISDLGYNLQNCCCQTQRAIDGVNYNMAKNTCDIIQAGNANTQRIIDFMTSDQIAQLRAENATLTAQLSQNAQTNTIINTLRPVAQPAYITCSPFESAYGYNRGCGFNSCGC